MKKIIALCLTIFTLICIVFYPRAIGLTNGVLLNFINNIIPALLPLIFLLNLLIEFNIIGKIMSKNVVLKEIVLVLISIFLGAPANIILLNKLEQSNIISKEKKYQLVSCFGTFSFSYLCFLFVYNVNLVNSYILLIIILFSEFLIYFIFFKKDNIELKKCTIKINKISFNNSMYATIKTLIFLLFTTLLMNLLFIFNPEAYETVPYLIMPFEFSYAGSFVKAMEFNYKEIILLIITSISTVSILLQLVYVDKNYNLYSHIKKRAMIALSSILLFVIFYF